MHFSVSKLLNLVGLYVFSGRLLNRRWVLFQQLMAPTINVFFPQELVLYDVLTFYLEKMALFVFFLWFIYLFHPQLYRFCNKRRIYLENILRCTNKSNLNKKCIFSRYFEYILGRDTESFKALSSLKTRIANGEYQSRRWTSL